MMVYRRRPQAIRALDFRRRGLRRKLLFSGAARYHAAADVVGAAAASLVVRGRVHGRFGGRWPVRLCHRRGAVRLDRALADPALWPRWQGRGVSRVLCPMGRGDHPAEGADADPLQARDDHVGFAGYNIWLFVLCSIVARGGRFFVVAVLLNRYGDTIRTELEKQLGLWVASAPRPGAGFYMAYRLI